MGGGSGGGGGNTTTVQQADPWKGQQPYLTELFELAQDFYNNGTFAPDYFPKSTSAPISDAMLESIDKQIRRASDGSPLIRAAQDQLTSTMSGEYLNNNPFMDTDGNPYLDDMVARAIGQTNAGVASNAATAGRYGSGAFHAAANDAAGNIATQMYGQAYDNDQNRALAAWTNERDNQMKGMLFAPDLANNDYTDLAALAEAGTAQENYWQEWLNQDIDRWNYEQNKWPAALETYANLIQGNYGMSGTSKTSGSSRTNPLGSAASGALAGGGLGYLLGGAANGSAYGLIGAGLGGLLGLF